MRVFTLVTLTILISSTIVAQDIPIKTHAIVDGSQFDVYPTEYGIQSFMLDDEMFGAFENPALGGLASTHSVTLLPTLYRQGRTDELGGQRSGRTLPLAAQYAGDRWFGSAMIAAQQLFFPTSFYSSGELHDESYVRENAYVALNMGTRLNDSGAIIGIGASGRALTAKEGPDQIVPSNRGFDRLGYQYRLAAGGVFPLGEQHRVDGVLSYERERLDRNRGIRVGDVPPNWLDEADPGLITFPSPNYNDHNDVYAGEVTYRYHTNERWTVGGNLRTQLHVHHDIAESSTNLPHLEDGRTMMYRLGIGAARETDRLEFTGDLAFEPGSARMTELSPQYTWPRPMNISIGHRNAFLRLNSRVFLGDLTVHAGTQIRYFDVRDDYQSRDNVRRWNEVAATVGLSYNFSYMQLSYLALVDSGPHIYFSSRSSPFLDSASHMSVISHPSNLDNRNDHGHRHRIQLTVPFGQ